MKKKSFLITVDTEGDNLWGWKEGDPISTENIKYIPRFQELCEGYGFKPVYLTNYEMIQNKEFMRYLAKKQEEGCCEVGLHIHAWNTPPVYPLENKFGGNPYMTEYPREIIYEKTVLTKNMLEDAIGSRVVSHRSGRWALNEEYLAVLAECGIVIDCSVTPQLNLSKLPGYSQNSGSDYRNAPKTPYYIHPEILEVPMTTRRFRYARNGSVKHRVKALVMKDELWLRPVAKSLNMLTYLTEKVEKERDTDYLEFMMHSSEFMPGGSPYFKTEEEIERMYGILENYFKYVTDLGYSAETLREYARNYQSGDR